MNYVYMLHDEKRKLLKVGCTRDLGKRLNTWRKQCGPLLFIGYIEVENRREAYGMEGSFIINKSRKLKFIEWQAFSKKLLGAFIETPGFIKKMSPVNIITVTSKNSKLVDLDIVRKVQEFRDRHGYKYALEILKKEGLSESMSQKLLCGTYSSKPDAPRMDLLKKALKK